MGQIMQMILGSMSNFKVQCVELVHMVLKMILIPCVLFIVECFQYKASDLKVVLRFNPVLRAILYLACFYLLIFGAGHGREFIYFEF
jgi:uncharacterized YccA/Bax inhibitor family protein